MEPLLIKTRARRIASCCVAAAALLLASIAPPTVRASQAGFAPVEEARPRAYRVAIRGPIDASVQSHITRAIKLAERDNARLVLDIDTPGGGVEVTWQISRAVQSAFKNGTSTIAWVNERATSAGAMLSLACDRLYMRSTATIGSALPVVIGPTGMQPVSEDPQVREKENSYVRESFAVIAKESGHSTLLAEAMVDPDIEIVLVELDGVEQMISGREYDELRDSGRVPRFVRAVVEKGKLLNIGGAEAWDLGLADGIVETLADLADHVGVTLSELVLVERTRSEDLADVLSVWTPLLLILAFVLAYIELKIPGFGIAGIGSIICFGLILFGRYLVGLADIPHVILMTLGIGLIATELFLFPGTIWIAAVGAVCLMGGIVWSFAGIGTGFEHALDREILLDESLRVMIAAVVAMVATWSLSRFLPKTPLFARLVLSHGDERATGAAMPEASGAHARVARVGARGRALTALRPVGKVALVTDDSIEFEARSNGPEIEADRTVVVIEVSQSGRLLVEVAPEDRVS